MIWFISGISGYVCYGLYFQVFYQEHPEIIKMFNEADFNCVVSEIITGAKRGPDGSCSVVRNLREQLERSSTEIFPFFEACASEIRNNIAKNEASSASSSVGFGKASGSGATLLVDGFSYDLSVDDISNFLRKKVPNARNVLVPHDRETKSTNGMAFVELGSNANVRGVIKKLFKLKMGDRSLTIKEYKPRTNGRPSGGIWSWWELHTAVNRGSRSDNSQRGFGERRRGFGVRGRGGLVYNFGGSIIRRHPTIPR